MFPLLLFRDPIQGTTLHLAPSFLTSCTGTQLAPWSTYDWYDGDPNPKGPPRLNIEDLHWRQIRVNFCPWPLDPNCKSSCQTFLELEADWLCALVLRKLMRPWDTFPGLECPKGEGADSGLSMWVCLPPNCVYFSKLYLKVKIFQKHKKVQRGI